MKNSTQRICLVAVGIALFVALSLCLQVPVFENYYLCLGYTVLAVYCWSFGTVDGVLVGSLGVVLYCLLTNGLRGMPGWALGNVVIAVILGWTFRGTKKLKAGPAAAIHAAMIVLASALGILIVKSAVESLLYAQWMAVRIGKNLYAFIADAVMLLVSLPVCRLLDGRVRKWFPLLVG